MLLKVFFISSLTLAVAFSLSSGKVNNVYRLTLRPNPANSLEYEEFTIRKIINGSKTPTQEEIDSGLLPTTVQTRVPLIDWVFQLINNTTNPSSTTTTTTTSSPTDIIELPEYIVDTEEAIDCTCSCTE